MTAVMKQKESKCLVLAQDLSSRKKAVMVWAESVVPAGATSAHGGIASKLVKLILDSCYAAGAVLV